jgi:hypothetical protein
MEVKWYTHTPKVKIACGMFQTTADSEDFTESIFIEQTSGEPILPGLMGVPKKKFQAMPIGFNLLFAMVIIFGHRDLR